MFTPPQRNSMSDSELQAALGAASADESGILKAMELLEAQSALREAEDKEFASWVEQLEQIGTPEALIAIENGRRAIAGLPPIEVETVESAVAQPAEIEPEQPQQVARSSHDLDSELSASLSALYAPAQYVGEPEESADIEAPAHIALPQDFEEHPALEEDAPVESAVEVQVEPEAEVPSEVEADEFLAIVEPSLAEVRSAVEDLKPVALPTDVSTTQSPEPVVAAQEVKRASRAISQVWPWLAVTNGAASVLLGFFVAGTNLKASEGIAAILLGLLIANIPVLASAISGKRSGLPILVTARAAFGVIGNQIPGWVLVVTRIFAAASVPFVFLTISVKPTSTAASAALDGSGILMIVLSLVALVGAVVLAMNYRWSRFASFWISALSAVFVIVLAALIAPHFSLSNSDFGAMSFENILIIAAVIAGTFMVIAAPAAADHSRELAKSELGLKVVGFTLLGSFAAPAIISTFFYLAFNGATTELSAESANGIAAVFALISPVAAFVFTAASLLAVVAITTSVLFSLKLSLASLVSKLGSSAAILVGAVVSTLVALIAFVFFTGETQAGFAFDLIQLASIPVVAWLGIISTDVLARRVAYHEVSLNRSYGFYKSFNFVNLSAWLVATVFGIATFTGGESFEVSTIGALAGFAAASGMPLAPLAISGLDTFIVFGFGFITPLVFGLPRILRQEKEALSLEARRDDLKDIFEFGG